MSQPSVSSPGNFIGNVVALMAVLLGCAYLVDLLATWATGKPFAICFLFPLIQVVLGHTVAIVIGTVGVVVLVFSGFKSGPGVALLAGALLLGSAPGLIAHYLGADTCAGQIEPAKTAATAAR